MLVDSVPRDAVDDAITACGVRERRSDGKLPAHVITYLTLGLALFRVVGMNHDEPGTDLLRGPFDLQSPIHLVVQPPARHELVFLRPRPLRIATFLRPNNPVRVWAAIPLDLPRNRRMMPIQQSADVTRRIPLGNTAGNLLPLLNIQLRKSAHSTLAHRSTNP